MKTQDKIQYKYPKSINPQDENFSFELWAQQVKPLLIAALQGSSTLGNAR